MLRRRRLILMVVAMLLAVAWLVAGHFLKQRGYTGTGQFLNETLGNYPKSFDAEPYQLALNVSTNDFESLQKVVADARARGVILPEGNEYVSAKITSDQGEFKGKIRIKGKLTDHVKGRKWSFRVLSKKGGGFHGMQRFSLQHPGTRNYLYEWFFQRMMKREGVIALRYGFVDVQLNNEPLGIYAYEEHFGQELLANNSRVPGPIFRFDPGLYWIHRLNEMNHIRFKEAFADHHAAMLDTYDSGAVFESKKRTEEFKQALIKMNALRSGLVSASDVFDTDKVALRHAVIDLIGGHHSMDWSDIKFYYNPVAQIIEPVSYESFSVRPLEQLAGAFRYVGKAQSRKEIHDVFFNDEQLFRQYVGHLERISETSYLENLFSTLQSELDSVSAIVFKEFPWKPLNPQRYYQNAKIIRAALDIPKGFHGFVSSAGNGKIKLQVVPIAGMPVELHSLRVGSEEIAMDTSIIIPARRNGQLGKVIAIDVNISDSLLANYKRIKLEWSVLGSRVKKVSGVVPMEYPNEIDLKDFAQTKQVKLTETPSAIFVDEVSKEFIVKGGAHEMTENLTVPEGYALVLAEACSLRFDGANLIVQGSMRSSSAEGVASVLEFVNGGALQFRNAKHGNELNNLSVLGDSSSGILVSMNQSNASFSNVHINGDGRQELLVLVNSRLDASSLHAINGNDLIKSYHSELNGDFVLTNALDDGLTLIGGTLGLKKNAVISIENCSGTGLKASGYANAELSNVYIKNASTGIRAQNGSIVKAKDCRLLACENGVQTDKADILNGVSKVQLQRVEFEGVKRKFRLGKGASITVEGTPIQSNNSTEK